MTPTTTPTSTTTDAPKGAPTRQTEGTTGAAPSRPRDAKRPPGPRPSSGRVVWVAIAAALAVAIWLVIASVTGNEPSGPAARSVGSDVHLRNLADELAAREVTIVGSDRHLRNLADELGDGEVTVVGSDRHLRNLAVEVAAREVTV